MQKLLLISNSASPGEAYLEKPLQDIANFLAQAKDRIVFIPFAGVTFSYDEYEQKVNNALKEVGIRVASIHRAKEPLKAISEASAIIIGGGNTFELLKQMHQTGILHAIRERVAEGVPYVGWSAGANVACPTIRTTNDMPIVEPPTFEALHFVPFQINPHYLDSHPTDHGGETREQRLLEFLVKNPDTYVVGLREGCRLFVEGDKIRMVGEKPARIFKQGEKPYELEPGSDFQFLMV